MNTLELTKKLIACPSVTPKDEGAQEILAAFLESHGFECHHVPFGEGEARVPNLFARIGSGGPHICLAGHTDVVPPGDEDAWTHGPFNPVVEGGYLYGRGAADMKGAVAAFAVAAAEYLKNNDLKGSISLLITGDEEGLSINGTDKVLGWMSENGHTPDVALVGEPTNPAALGDEIKIGRRGSLSGKLSVKGTQGHVAYQHLAHNPIPALVKLLDALGTYEFDQGSEFFPPTNLEITNIDIGNTADNVIPASARASFNIRFNDHWSKASLSDKVREILDETGQTYSLDLYGNAESFITQPGAWTEIVRGAVKDITGREARYTTNGGTSDARFIVRDCPVVEFGDINATIHQVNERVRVEDLENLCRIYGRVLARYFS